MSVHRVAITGLGAVTSLGQTVDAVWPRLLAGENGIAPISSFDASDFPTKVAGEVRDIPAETRLQSFPASRCRRAALLFQQAAHEAYEDSQLGRSPALTSRSGVAAGTSVNYVDSQLVPYFYSFRREELAEIDMPALARDDHLSDSGYFRRLGDLPAALAAKSLNLGGPNLSIDTACAAGSFAIGEAFRLIQRGKVPAMVAGGAAALVRPIGLLAFSLLGALSKNPDPERASRPFDRERDGFVMGEGAAVVVLEEWRHAIERRAHIHAEVVGFGTSLNAYNLTDPSPEGACEEHAMRMALEEASLAPPEVDYIAVHGTSTPKNDATETSAIKRLFGDHAKSLAVSSNKGQIGHTISAAGPFNLVFTVRAMQDSCVPPTMHYQNFDPECDLDCVPNQSRPLQIRSALVNAFAFGGQNAVLAVRNLTT